MVAMRLPPNVGRVCCSRRVSGSMARPVQSAVSPHLTRAATHGASSRPKAVAPNRTISGERVSMRSTIQVAKGSHAPSARRLSLATSTWSAPAPASSCACPSSVSWSALLPSMATTLQPSASARPRAAPTSSKATGNACPSAAWANTHTSRHAFTSSCADSRTISMASKGQASTHMPHSTQASFTRASLPSI